MTTQDTEELAAATKELVEQNGTLEEVSLQQWHHVGEYLPALCASETLRSIELKWCKLGDKGMQRLAAGLRTNRTLEELIVTKYSMETPRISDEPSVSCARRCSSIRAPNRSACAISICPRARRSRRRSARWCSAAAASASLW